MATPILTTKLYIPPLRENVVIRPRLIERLREGLRRKLTLISAPAGFGKTTLLNEWVDRRGQPAAWLALDEGDSDPARFWSHFIAALQTLEQNIGVGELAALQSPQLPAIEALLTSLLNELATLPDDFVLILDDYHSVDSKPIEAALAFLIERLPPRMHLVIATREDPDLPLARLRARDQLVELRVADLRFTEAEAADFLNQTMGLRLTGADIAASTAQAGAWARLQCRSPKPSARK